MFQAAVVHMERDKMLFLRAFLWTRAKLRLLLRA